MPNIEFKINKVDYVNKTFRLPASLVEELGKKSNEAGVSMNKFIIQALQFAFENLVVEDKNDDK